MRVWMCWMLGRVVRWRRIKAKKMGFVGSFHGLAIFVCVPAVGRTCGGVLFVRGSLRAGSDWTVQDGWEDV